MFTNFEVKILIILLKFEVNMGIHLNISRFCFDCSMICVVVFVNYLIQLIDVHIFDTAVLWLKTAVLRAQINLLARTDFSLLCDEYISMPLS